MHVPKYLEFRFWCQHEDWIAQGLDEIDVVSFRATLISLLPSRLRDAVGLIKLHEIKVYSFRLPVEPCALEQIKYIVHSACYAVLLLIRGLRPRACQELPPERRAANREFAKLVSFVRKLCSSCHAFELNELVVSGHPGFDIFIRASSVEADDLASEACKFDLSSKLPSWHRTDLALVGHSSISLLSEHRCSYGKVGSR